MNLSYHYMQFCEAKLFLIRVIFVALLESFTFNSNKQRESFSPSPLDVALIVTLADDGCNLSTYHTLQEPFKVP